MSPITGIARAQVRGLGPEGCSGGLHLRDGHRRPAATSDGTLVGRRAKHRTTQYLNNYTEQSHRAVKQRYYPTLGFGNFESASRFCSAFDEMRDYFRVKCRGQPHVSLADQRQVFIDR